MWVMLLSLVLLTAATLAFTLTGLDVVRRLVRSSIGDEHNIVHAAIFTVGGTIYAVFLAFLVVTVWADHDAAKRNVADEASLLATLYRGSTIMEPQSGGRLRAAIREYTRAVIDDEWPIQARSGGASEPARRAGLKMLQVFGAVPAVIRPIDPTIDRTQLDLITQLQADRNKRTLSAQEAVSPMIWAIAIVNGVLVIVMSFFLFPGRDWPHVVMSTMLAAMVAMMIFVIYVFEQPFRGLLPLGSEAFAHSLEVYDSVDRSS
jgi:hypothetical protein